MKILFADERDASTFVRRFRLFSDDLSSFARSMGTLLAFHRHDRAQDLARALNRHAAHWNAVLAALQVDTFVIVARIHDRTRGAYLGPFTTTLSNAALQECKAAAAQINSAVIKHKLFIDKVVKLRHGLFAHTSHEAPLHISFGFEGLEWNMFESYWVDMSEAMKAVESATFRGRHGPAISGTELQEAMVRTNAFLDELIRSS